MAMERILANGVSQILNKLVPVVAQEISLAWGVKDELKKVQRTLDMILAVITDAERRQEEEEAVRLWLRSLKDVAFDADDVMDDFTYETLRRDERGNHLKNKLLDFVWFSNNPLGFSFKMAGKVRNINRRLNEITENMNKFQLQSASVNNTSMVHGESSDHRRRRQTASVIIQSEVVGRKDDKNKIIDMITKATASSSSSDVNQSSEKVSIISIVGMGGLGKTTLAQLVYNDELVIKQFDQRIWVCVSTNFDVENIFIKIMESITLDKFDSVSSFDLLVNKVQEKLQGKKFLLVLDDLWNENALQWERLKNSFHVGAQGSKILITTRNIQVENVVKGSDRPYQLKKLQEDECWSIIEKKAFSPGGALKTPNMTNIGKEIANKCSGLSLAAKFLGSLMHSKNEEKDWLSIKESGIWNTQEGQSEIRPVLKLSYDNLSPHLKQCFSYCSIFPKGSEIRREILIHLWMAEGFFEPSSNIVGNERSMEEIGEEFFDSLLWSSFLDGVKKNELDDIVTCKMHDLGRDVVGNRECASANIS
ncbi:putative disease resistance protein RGA3 [Papaver somniferum]|uniref:putative disease resistance protein RGA3 n=1 Tax=Papaver somniferum TaxID=3469 RepID=UPI000E6F6EA3|nr:putative disease resistance protein RGA3 [Papaver somniferum]